MFLYIQMFFAAVGIYSLHAERYIESILCASVVLAVFLYKKGFFAESFAIAVISVIAIIWF